MANAPFSWTPTNLSQAGLTMAQADLADMIPGTMLPGGDVMAGDWIQIVVSYRRSSGHAVAYTANRFLMHVIYTPNSDDALPKEDQAVTYGGPQNGVNNIGGNRRRNYHIDINVWFQVPFDGQLSIVAGDLSPADVTVDVLVNRGFAPRDAELQGRLMNEADDLVDRALHGGDDKLIRLAQGYKETVSAKAPRKYAPPIIGTPQLVPSTWIDIPANLAGGLPFPDGAVKFEAVFAVAAVIAAPRLTITNLGAGIPVDIPGSGLPITVAALTGGMATTFGVRATWACNQPLTTATVWSSLGG